MKQDYPSVEVIISDDSPGEDIKQVIEPFRAQLDLKYIHNIPALKTPRNWNRALDLGRGEYLLLLHQDDWFHAPDALSSFAKAMEDPGVDFVFCQNTAIDERGGKVILQAIPPLLHRLERTPHHLVLAQVIGPPSNTMVRRTVKTRYDERMIWLVDVDYYSSMLKQGYHYRYLPRHLVSIGLHEDQATVFCRAHPEIIIRENMLVAEKFGMGAFNDILIFDYYWRFLRNYMIRSVSDLLANGVKEQEISPVILSMLHQQKNIPLRLLRIGAVSKLLMAASYIAWKIKPRRPHGKH